MNINQIRYFGGDGVCSRDEYSSLQPIPPIPLYCNTGIDNVCVNPLDSHIVVYYTDGRIQDTGIVANCGTNCFTNCSTSTPIMPSICNPTAISCTPKRPTSFLNGVQYTNQNELIFTYNDGSSCNIGELCKCQTVIFSQNQVPTCGCPSAKCGDVFINLATGNVYIFFGQAWDIIGNLQANCPTGPTGDIGPAGPTGPTGPTGLTSNIILSQGTDILVDSSNVDDYPISSDSSFFIFSPSSTQAGYINGLSGGVSGRIIYIVNNSEYPQTFKSEVSSSSVDNRFLMSTTSLSISVNHTAVFIYTTNLTVDSTPNQSRWVLLSYT